MNKRPAQGKNTNENFPITKFQGYYNFLSNDFPAWVCYEGLLYPSLNIAFQAARTNSAQIRAQLSKVENLQQFTNIALSITNPQNWSQRKEKVMEVLLRDKFKRNKELTSKLLSTKDRKLINGMKKQGFNELYWGIFENKGNNILGKLIMEIRQQIVKGKDTLKWIQQNLQLQKDTKMLADVQLLVVKDGKKIDKLFLDKGKNYYLFGSVKTHDFPLQNPTISRNHACICFTSDLEVILVDFNSTHCTFLKKNGQQKSQKVDCLIPYKLEKGDCIQFGTSARQYQVSIDRSAVEKYIEQAQNLLKDGMNEQANFLQGRNFQEIDEKQIEKFLGVGNRCLLVYGLSDKANYHELKQEFGKIGRIQKIRMVIDRKTGKFQGKSIVYFQKIQSLQQALKKRNQIQYKIKQISQQAAEQLLQNRKRNEKGDEYKRKNQQQNYRSRQKKSKY